MSQIEKSPITAFDRLGVIASAGCAVHCIAMPFVLSFLAVYAHFLPTEEYVHRTLAVVVSLLGAIALGAGYRKHRNFTPLL
jgi:hypothetical protein